MKIRVSVHGRFHGFALAKALHELGALEKIQTTYPKLFARRVLGDEINLDSAGHLEFVRRIGQRISRGQSVDVWVARRFADYVANSLDGIEASVLVGWSSALLEAIEPAQRQGVKVVVERGSTHIDHQTEILLEAYERVGLKPRTAPIEFVSREREEYASADMISVLSDVAADSFLKRGFSPEKIFVNHLGVDIGEFRLKDTKPSHAPLEILSVGEVGVRKGAIDLIDAFEQFADVAQMKFVGLVEPDFGAVLKTRDLVNVDLIGPMARDTMPQAYASADIFCLPSVEEGFGMAVLEAMASGLPVVVSDQVGAADIVEHGVSGFIVPVHDVDALSGALSLLIRDSDMRYEMGRQARKAVEAMSGWDEYAERSLRRYKELVATNASS